MPQLGIVLFDHFVSIAYAARTHRFVWEREGRPLEWGDSFLWEHSAADCIAPTCWSRGTGDKKLVWFSNTRI